MSSVRGGGVVCYEGLNNWLRLEDGGKGGRVSTVQPSLMDAPMITWNQEEGADGHGHAWQGQGGH